MLFKLSTSIVLAQAIITVYLGYWKKKKKIPAYLSSSILPSVPTQSVPLTSLTLTPQLRNIQWFLISSHI